MSPSQIFGYFSIRRDADGRPEPRSGDDGKTEFDYYAEYVRDQCGVWDDAERRRMWAARKALAAGGET